MDAAFERRIARRASSQSGLITRQQLLEIGCSNRQVDRCIRIGRIAALQRGVFLIAGAPLDDAVRLRAATLRTGGVASHRSAAHLLGLIDSPPIDALETALERALRSRATNLDRLLRRFFELAARGRPGTASLRSLLVERDPSLAPAESDLETLLSKILRRGGLPAPVRQFEVLVAGQRFRLDAAYPELMIFIEGDGFGVHSMRGSFERDRSRQNLLVVAGWSPLRFTWRRLCRSPQSVVSEVRAARLLRQQLIS